VDLSCRLDRQAEQEKMDMETIGQYVAPDAKEMVAYMLIDKENKQLQARLGSVKYDLKTEELAHQLTRTAWQESEASKAELVKACEFAVNPEAPYKVDKLNFANEIIRAIAEKAKAAIAKEKKGREC